MDASVWMKSLVRSPRRRGCARWPRRCPTVTVRSRPKGLPIAMAHCPTRSRSESPSSATGSAPVGLSILTHREVGLGSRPTSVAVNLRSSERRTSISVGVLDHVVVRQDVATRIHDDARARGAALFARRPPAEEALEELVAEELAEALLHLGRRAALRPGLSLHLDAHVDHRGRGPIRDGDERVLEGAQESLRIGRRGARRRGAARRLARGRRRERAQATRRSGAASARRRIVMGRPPPASYLPMPGDGYSGRGSDSIASSSTRVVGGGHRRGRAAADARHPDDLAPRLDERDARALPPRHAGVDQEGLEPPQRRAAERARSVAAAAGRVP